MSFFSQPVTTGSSSSGPGSSSLFASLGLDTTVPASDSSKRKSVFEPSSTTTARAGTSLFGQPATTTTTAAITAPSSNMFGTTPNTTTNAPSSGGLFGSTTTTTAPASGGLFGSTANTAASGGLFGSANSTKPTTSLFGPLSTTTSAAGGGGGGGGGGLFGTTTTQPSAPAGGSIFGTTTQQPQSTSMFASTVNNPAAVTQAQNQITQTSYGQPPNRESAYFRGLLERQNKKVKLDSRSQSDALSHLPSMDMDLGDLARRAQELGGRNTKPTTSNGRDSRAHYLLSGSGVVPGQAYRDFQKLDGENIPTISNTRTDFTEEGNAYLRGMQTRGREAMLKESMARVYREVDAYVEQSLGIDFDQQKRRIMQHFGLIAKDDDSDEARLPRGSFGQSTSVAPATGTSRRSIFGRSGLDKSIIGNASSVNGTSAFFSRSSTNNNAQSSLNKNQTMRDLRDKERLFMEKVSAMNQARLNDTHYKVLLEFGNVEAVPTGDHPRQLQDAYLALQQITREGTGVRERQYAEDYLIQTVSSTRKNTRLKRQILDGSRTYLEQSFYQELEQTVGKNPRSAQIGGMPTVLNKIRGYVRIREERNDLISDTSKLQRFGDNQDLCWAIIFYLLRSGHVQEAAKYVTEHEAFQTTDRRFVSYLSAYAQSPNRRLSRKFQDMINGEYQQRTKVAPQDTIDPYRIACYKIIGRCDLEQRNLEQVGQGVEDWLWLQFSLARESDTPEDATGDIFGLEQIVETVSEIGQKHFQKGQSDSTNSYGTFFLMQILAGMFEQAVDYLHSFNPVSAVHFAIALAYYGLLRVSDYQTAGNELLTFTTTQEPQINFVPLIAYYTTAFRAALPVAAVDYLVFICLNSDLKPAAMGNTHTNACHECLRELCLETREFAALLGDIRNDGTRLAGAIQQRDKLIRLDNHEQFLRSITSQAAAVANQRGQTADAVLLYHLCDDYDNVTQVLNNSLADAVAVELGDVPMSLQPLKRRDQSTSDGQEQHGSSLSLTQSSSSPAELAQNLMSLYDSNAMYYSRISPTNRQTCKTLLQLLRARSHIEGSSPDYLRGITEINDVGVLPLNASGNIQLIRQLANSFGNFPQLIARSSGISILWAIRAIGAERERLSRDGSWSAYGSENDLAQLKGQLAQMAKDLMVFAGLVKYKLPSRVYDMLTRAGSDVGSY